MRTVEMPGGHRAVFLDVDDVTGRLRKEFFQIIKPIEAVDVGNYGIAFFIREWSLELPLPKVDDPTSLEALDNLPVKTLDALGRYIAHLIQDITPNFDPDPDPASPTSPSGV